MSRQSIVTTALSSESHNSRYSMQTIACAVWHQFTLAWQIRSERCMLAYMSDEALRDMGIERSAASAESNRNLFDLPANRR